MRNAVKARPRERMICLELRFWTNGLVKRPGHVIPRHCKSAGMIHFQGNKTHGFRHGQPVPSGVPFHSISEISVAVEKLLVKGGVTVVPVSRQKRLQGK